jgi:hypothetical protein
MSKSFMKLEYINDYGDRTKVEFESDCANISEAEWFIQNFRQFMLAVSFHPDTVNQYLPEE